MIFLHFICGKLNCFVVPDLLVIYSDPELNDMSAAEHQVPYAHVYIYMINECTLSVAVTYQYVLKLKIVKNNVVVFTS